MFALVAFAVAQRTREIGIRWQSRGTSDILRVLLSQNFMPIAPARPVGVFAGIALGRIVRGFTFLRKMLWIPVGLCWALASFALTRLLATLSPALRALRIDPVINAPLR